MKEIYGNASYKIMKVILSKGEVMPLHAASSDAFIIVEKGKAKVCFTEKDVALEQGSYLHIPAKEIHSLEVLEDFNALVILAGGAGIQFIDQ